MCVSDQCKCFVDLLFLHLRLYDLFLGMNMNNRRMMSYVEYEPKQYYTAFSMEFESVAAVMWEIHRAILKMVRYFVVFHFKTYLI